ncbi:MAG: hypothetical protein RR253_01540 [Oscillospiraceae bacterium]
MAGIENNLYYEYIEKSDPHNALDSTFNIMVVDIESGNRSYLCNRAECKHNDESCASFYSVRPEYLFYNDEFLFVGGWYKPNGENSVVQIYMSDLNGDNRRLCYQPLPEEAILGSFVLGKDYMFFDENVMITEKPLTVKKKLKKLNIRTGESEFIYDFKGNEQIIGAYGDIIYINAYAGSSLSSVISQKSTIFSIDMNGNVLEKNILEWKGEETQFRNFGKYFVEFKKEPGSLVVTNLETKERVEYTEGLSEITKEGFSLHFVDEDVIRFGAKDDETERFLKPYSLNRKTKEVSSVTWRREGKDAGYMGVDILAQNADKFLVVYAMGTTSTMVDSVRPQISTEPELVEKQYMMYATISKEDYINDNRNLKPVKDYS